MDHVIDSFQFYYRLNEELKISEGDEKHFLLTLLSATQDAGLWFMPDGAQSIVGIVLDNAGQAAAEGIFHNAAETLRSGGSAAFFSMLRKEKVPEYLLKTA